MFTSVSDNFKTFNTTAETDVDNFSNAKVEFTADTDSISTNNEQRDQHLKGADFFDAAAFPTISFTATKPADAGDGNFELTGNLMMHGVLYPVKLAVEFGGIVMGPWNNIKAGFCINGKLSRKDFGLNWNAALEAGGVMVSDEVKIHGEIQLVKQA